MGLALMAPAGAGSTAEAVDLAAAVLPSGRAAVANVIGLSAIRATPTRVTVMPNRATAIADCVARY